MKTHSHIESFFNALNISWQDLIEFLPVGVIIFDENWEIKSVNRNFADFFEEEWVDIKLKGNSLFSQNMLITKLPLNEILLLKSGKYFEKQLTFSTVFDSEFTLLFKGAPIFKNGLFKGGILIVEDYDPSKPKNEIGNVDSITSFLYKICKNYLIINAEGFIQIASESGISSYPFFNEQKGKNISQLFDFESELLIRKTVSNVISKCDIQTTELNYTSTNNKRITFNSVFIPLTTDVNNTESIVVLLREIDSDESDIFSNLTNLDKVKELESFATTGADGLFKISLSGDITYWANNASDLFNINEEKIISNFIGKIFPEINNEFFNNIKTQITDNGFWEGYLSCKINDLDSVVKVKILSQNTGSNSEMYVYCNKLDLEQQKEITNKKEEETFFKDTVIKSNQMILQANLNGTILFANDKFINEFEYESDEINGLVFTDLINKTFKLNNKIFDLSNLLTNKKLKILPLYTKIGNSIEASFNISTTTEIETKEPKYFTIILTKIDNKDKLLASTSKKILKDFHEAVVIIHDNKIINVNHKFLQLFNYEFEFDVINKNVNEIVDINSQNYFDKSNTTNFLSEEEKSITFIKKDLSNFEANIRIINSSNETSYYAFIITPPKLEKPETNNQNEDIRKELDINEFCFWSATLDNNSLKYNYISHEVESITGYKSNEFISQTDLWKKIIHPDDLEEVETELEFILNEAVSNLTKVNYRIVNKDGEIVWNSNKIKVARDSEGKVTKVLGYINNITKSSLEKEELNIKIENLEKLNKAKDKFISIISHDLKSPFTSIVGFADLIISDTTLEKEEIIEFVKHIKDASLHTVDLLNGILELTKLQTGRIDITPQIINARHVANKTAEILSGLAYQKGLTFKLNVDNLFYINADENLIFQVFNNLVANSIKFTPKGGSIEISARELQEQQMIEFTVKDTGMGIEEEDLEKLFVVDKKFTTLGTDGERGTGLGLSLVKEIIEKHNGQISVKSEVGVGSRFIFTLPITSPSILIIDGNHSESNLYANLLKNITEGIEIIQADNEKSGYQLAKEKMPMLIIFEHDLPNMKGYDFVDIIKKSDLVYKPFLMLLTKNLDAALIDLYKQIGIEESFNKPFDFKKFRDHLDKITGKNK